MNLCIVHYMYTYLLAPLASLGKGQQPGRNRKYSPKSSLITFPIFCESSLSLCLLSGVICLSLISWQSREKRCGLDRYLSISHLLQTAKVCIALL